MGAKFRRTPLAIVAGATLITGSLLASVFGAVPVASAASAKHALPSITTIPIQVAQTSDGAVSYRSDGSGPPLVMIMGLEGSQDTWPPALVNALAKHHRVIIFDNAGIGQTALPPGTLTISAMANQTDALIQALGLVQPEVFGWSMGGMIAQALAILHPGDVSRLVLAATCGGDGDCTLGPGASSIQLELFPAKKAAKFFSLYTAEITTFPGFYAAPSSVATAELSAIGSWAAGDDPGGHGTITVPTLIGDGADDVLISAVSSSAMQAAIPGSQLHLYKDAGHGFLIQDEGAWAKRVNTFLAG